MIHKILDLIFGKEQYGVSYWNVPRVDEYAGYAGLCIPARSTPLTARRKEYIELPQTTRSSLADAFFAKAAKGKRYENERIETETNR